MTIFFVARPAEVARVGDPLQATTSERPSPGNTAKVRLLRLVPPRGFTTQSTIDLANFELT